MRVHGDSGQGATAQPNEPVTPVPAPYAGRFWMAVLVVGAVSGAVGAALMTLLHVVQHATWQYRAGDFEAAVARATAARRVVALIAAGCIAGAAAKAFKGQVAGYGAGLTEAIWFRAGELPFFGTVLRGAVSIVVVAMGAALGREGALKQVGAAIAAALARWLRIPPARRRVLAAAGAAAGFAAAYDVPFGAALFALEVLLGSLALDVVPPVLAASVLAAVVSRALSSNGPVYAIPRYAATWGHVAWALAAAPIFALAAVGYVRAIAWFEARKPRGWREIASPPIALALLGVASIAYPQLLGNGKGVADDALHDRFSVGLLVLLPALRLLFTGVCLGSGVPGGLFTPTLCIGALLGALLGRAATWVIPGAAMGSYALLGATAFVAATTYGPLSAVVLSVELTGDLGLAAPLLLVSALACALARAIEPRSVYSARARRFATESVRLVAKASPALDGLVSRRCAVISAATRLPEIAARVAARGDDAPLYVVDDRGRLLGVVDAAVFRRASPAPAATVAAADLVEPAEETIAAGGSVEEAFARLMATTRRSLPVVAEDGRLVGELSRDAIEAAERGGAAAGR